MKTSTLSGITGYPADFIVSCAVRHLRPEVFLQHFVDNFYYSSLFCETLSKIEFAVNIIIYSQFMHSLDREPLGKDKALHVICKEQLDEIIDDGATNESAKRAVLVPVLKKFREAICQDPDQVSEIGLPGGCALQLSDSLVVVCFLYGVLPERIIKNLIDNISLPILYAKGKALRDGDNHYMEVFYRISDDLSQGSEELDQTNHDQYHDMLTDLYKQMKDELDFDVRYARFKTAFRKWHNSIKHIEIKPIVL